MKLAELILCEANDHLIAKRIPDGYREGKWVWAVVIPNELEDEIVESGFDRKKDALAWIAQMKETK